MTNNTRMLEIQIIRFNTRGKVRHHKYYNVQYDKRNIHIIYVKNAFNKHLLLLFYILRFNLVIWCFSYF